MGCDIHLFLEVKIWSEWHYYQKINMGRDYLIFAKMANVRNEYKEKVTPIDYPRGLPCDVSKITQIHYKGMEEDAHSCSWLGYDEIGELVEFILSVREDMGWSIKGKWFNVSVFGDWLSDFGLDYFYKGVQDIRFVFWFDN